MTESFSHRVEWPLIPNSLSLAREAMLAQGTAIIDASCSNPVSTGLADFWLQFFDGSKPAHNVNLFDSMHAYNPDPKGWLKARENIVHYRNTCTGQKFDNPENVLITSSSSESYSWLFKLLCNPGDLVMVPKPGYPLFDHLAQLEGVGLCYYRLEYFHGFGWTLDLEYFKNQIAQHRPKAVILINPNNPTGSYIGDSERELIIDMCTQFNCAIIADEVFFNFCDQGTPISWRGENRVLSFVLDGLSKGLGLPQLKTGWIEISGPKDVCNAAIQRLEVIADAFLSPNWPAMYALDELFSHAPQFVRLCMDRIAHNMSQLMAVLHEPGSPHRILSRGGGWSALIESPRLISEEEASLGLLKEKKVYMQPGWFFDMDKEIHFAVSLIIPPDVFAKAVIQYKTFFDEAINWQIK